MFKMAAFGGFVGLLVGFMFGGAIAGGWGAVAGGAIGLTVGAAAMGALWRAGTGWTSKHHGGAVAFECPVHHEAITVHVRRDKETGRPIEIVGCTHFADASGVTCDRRCLEAVAKQEMGEDSRGDAPLAGASRPAT